MSKSQQRPDATESLTATLGRRIMILDGAMGTAIQRDRPDEAGYRGERFADWPSDVQGNNDLLTLTAPEIIAGIHREYLEAGADIIETNTFNANAISLSDYGMEELAYELNLEAAAAGAPCGGRHDGAHARQAALRRRRARADDANGSISPDVNDPGARNVTFDQLRRGLPEPARGLVDGGVDLLLIETIFDTLNAKAAIFAVETLFEEQGRRWPVDRLGHHHRRVRAHALRPGHRGVLGLGPARLAARASASTAPSAPRRCGPTSPRCRALADSFVSCYPNAGLPNAFGEYDEAPDETAAHRR